MKLRNKKTGEIGYPYFQNWKEINCVIVNENAIQIAKYSSLAELNEEWEDYEEPKPWWYIDITLVVKQGKLFLSKHVEQFKTVGNYFETREEAERTVEKLKAWKRLKDKGLMFKGINEDDGSIKTGLSKGVKICDSVEFYEDMTLLFGGEE